MTTKVCTKCGIEKELSEFCKHNGLPLGVNSSCKQCESKQNKRRYEENKEELKKKVMERYYKEVREAKLAKTAAKKAELEAHRKSLQERGIKICTKCGETKPVEDFSIKSKAYDGRNPSCRECENKKIARHYQEHRDDRITKAREYYEEHKEEIRAREKSRRQNPEARQRKLEADREYYHRVRCTPEGKEKEKARRKQIPMELKRTYRKRYHIKQTGTSPIYTIKRRVSRRIRSALYNFNAVKDSPVSEIVGCTLTELVAHLLSTMPPNSTEADLLSPEYHVDHIVPIACAKSPEEVLKLNHYTNLRMLPATENLLKRDKIISEAIELHATLLSRTLTTDPLFNLMVEATEENKEAFERLK